MEGRILGQGVDLEPSFRGIVRRCGVLIMREPTNQKEEIIHIPAIHFLDLDPRFHFLRPAIPSSGDKVSSIRLKDTNIMNN
jgi:hypothetical protein